MRLLFIHSDHLEYEARAPVGSVAEPIEGDRAHSFDECLVVFITVEEEDTDHGKGLVQRVADEITDVMEQVNAPRVVVYPWAHLSSDLAPAHVSVPLLKEIELELMARDVVTDRAAFGWYKSFTMSWPGTSPSRRRVRWGSARPSTTRRRSALHGTYSLPRGSSSRRTRSTSRAKTT
jgi:threonyl-tRNA synthetase